MKKSRGILAAPVSRGGRLLVLGVIGLGVTMPGCGEKEGIVEIKQKETFSIPNAIDKTPQKGPKRAGAGARDSKPAT